MTTQTVTRPLILGTAGHIDHGKTALVRALTGVDTDRLPEEQRRGITIDIGFAELDLGGAHLGIVDVPGHERFIKNMLAGATGIDLALLVVAADDSVMPQTREHLDILRLLDVQTGVIALTKCDLPEPDWLDLVEDEVRELVRGTFLENAPIVRTSATTGDGVDELREALSLAAQSAKSRAAGRMLRLAVDRTFVVQGHGTIVTGTVWSGEAQVGDELHWQPAGKSVRVRSLESHGRDVERIERGQRAAIGLTGVHHSEITRGDEIATAGYLRPSQLMTVRLSVLDTSPWPIKHRARVRLHLGTREVMAAVSLLTEDKAVAGATLDAQLTLAQRITATCGQPFVIRSESPLITIGGGHVLQPVARRIRRRQHDVIKRVATLADDDPLVRAATATYFFGLRDWTPADICRDANVNDVDMAALPLVEIPVSPTRTIHVHEQILADATDRLLQEVDRYHLEHPLRPGVPRAQLKEDALVNKLIADDVLAGNEHLAWRAGFAPDLSETQQRLLDRIVAAYHQSGYQPPEPDDLVDDQSPPALVRQLMELAAAQGTLTHLGGGLYLHADHEHAMRAKIADRLTHVSGMTVAQIRDLLGTSRKFAVPICEYLDRVGCTKREGDLRVAGRKP